MTAQEYSERFKQIIRDAGAIDNGLVVYLKNPNYVLSDSDIERLFARITSTSAKKLWDTLFK